MPLQPLRIVRAQTVIEVTAILCVIFMMTPLQKMVVAAGCSGNSQGLK
jgi:hypothetical protein